MKEIIRTLLYPVAVALGGDLYAVQGSLLCKFLTWLYGDGEPQHDGWIYPDDSGRPEN